MAEHGGEINNTDINEDNRDSQMENDEINLEEVFNLREF